MKLLYYRTRSTTVYVPQQQAPKRCETLFTPESSSDDNDSPMKVIKYKLNTNDKCDKATKNQKVDKGTANKKGDKGKKANKKGDKKGNNDDYSDSDTDYEIQREIIVID